MDLYEAMSTLRAVRRLKPDPIPPEVTQRILQAAAWAPTGGNTQPWRVVVVRERAAKQKLGTLYEARWKAYSAGHRKLLAKAPADVAAKTERMIAAGDFFEQFGITAFPDGDGRAGHPRGCHVLRDPFEVAG